MFRIGEFSKLTQVSVRMLRYYGEYGLLKPAQTDAFTGYRMYSVEQISQLNKIVFLRDAGFGVGEMAELLANWDEALVARRFREKQEEIRLAIRAEEEKLDRLRRAMESPGPHAELLHYDVMIKNIPAHQVLSYRKVIPDYYAEGMMWKEMALFAQENKIQLTGETFSIYHDVEYKEQDVDVELCAHVSHMGTDGSGFTYRCTAPVEQMACTMVYGPFERIAGAFQSFAGWLAKHEQYKMGNSSRQIVHRGPWNEEEPEKYLTEIQIPLQKTG